MQLQRSWPHQAARVQHIGGSGCHNPSERHIGRGQTWTTWTEWLVWSMGLSVNGFVHQWVCPINGFDRNAHQTAWHENNVPSMGMFYIYLHIITLYNWIILWYDMIWYDMVLYDMIWLSLNASKPPKMPSWSDIAGGESGTLGQKIGGDPAGLGGWSRTAEVYGQQDGVKGQRVKQGSSCGLHSRWTCWCFFHFF